MEHKTWLWKRKSSEKVTNSSQKSEVFKGKALALERSLEELNEQLSYVRNESSNKDDLLSMQAKVAEEAIKGWEKAEAEAVLFKQQLEDALLHKEATEERIVNTEAALKECMRQLEIVKEDQQLIIHNAATKISREQEKVRVFEDRLAEANKSLSEAVDEISNLRRTLEAKEQLIRDLSESKSKSQANCKELMSKLESSEKTNASLKYEVCVLQKELEIRNQEKEFNLKSADAAHRQQLESIKKIAKLESECQKLRVMIRKRLPGPAAIAKMRNEVEMLGTDNYGYRKKKLNSTSQAFSSRDFSSEDHDTSRKTIASLIERLHVFEEENNVLRESLNKKIDELQLTRVMFARAASKLSQPEKHAEELSRRGTSDELMKRSSMSYELSLPSISARSGDEDNASCAESWASALLSELEHFRNGKPTTASSKSTGMSELSLMDDFIEMEKLAIVSVGQGVGSSLDSSRDNKPIGDEKGGNFGLDSSEMTGKELVPVSNPPNLIQTNQTDSGLLESSPSWLQDIRRLIIQRSHATRESIDMILDEVRAALSGSECLAEAKCIGNPCFSGGRLQQARCMSSDSFDGSIHSGMINSGEAQRFPSKLEMQLIKLIELIEGIIQRTRKSEGGLDLICGDHKSSPLPNKSVSLDFYVTRTFLWKSSELTDILQKFVLVCNDLLHGKVELERFTSEINLAFDWILNHCFSLEDVPDMKEIIEKNLNAEDTQTDSHPDIEKEKVDARYDSSVAKEMSVSLLSASVDDTGSKLKDENDQLKLFTLESRKNDLEEKLKAASVKNETLFTHLQKSEKDMPNSTIELSTIGDFDGHMKDQKLIRDDLGKQFVVAKAELKDAQDKFTSLACLLKEKSDYCEKLEMTCLELQLQLESMSSKESSRCIADEEEQQENQLQTDNELAKASEKLAACQETILNLGRQFKALASPQDAPLFDKVITSPVSKVKHRRQLLDHIRAEDDANFEELKSPKTKEIICAESPNAGLFYGKKINTKESLGDSIKSIIVDQPMLKSPHRPSVHEGSDRHEVSGDGGKLVLVHRRQKVGTNLLRKLLLRRKDVKKITLPTGS